MMQGLLISLLRILYQRFIYKREKYGMTVDDDGGGGYDADDVLLLFQDGSGFN
jgi:hypothetical protein